MKKAMVFGASGQLGVEIGKVIEARGYETMRFDRKQVDIADTRQVEEAVSAFDPSLVFNCAAYNQVDLAESEPQAALASNALGVRNLALACRQNDATLVHFSTDYVFDGTAGRPYVETDATHPLGAYAVSKRTGELFVKAYLDRALIVRTSGVFGPAGVRSNRGNFVELMLRLANSGQPIRVVEDHVASPTYAPFLAEKSVELALAGASGIFASDSRGSSTTATPLTEPRSWKRRSPTRKLARPSAILSVGNSSWAAMATAAVACIMRRREGEWAAGADLRMKNRKTM